MTQSTTPPTSATTATLTASQRFRRFLSAPTLLFLIIITQIPFVFAIYYSFRTWNLNYPNRIGWAGWDNYTRIVGDPNFWPIVWNTLVLSVSVVVITFVMGMILALLLNRPFRGRALARTLLISPFLVMPVVTAVLWKNSLLHPTSGLSAYILRSVGLQEIDWLAHYAMPSIIATVSWQWTPFVMLILLAGLQSLPVSTLEAASLDGASGWNLLRYIILPHLRSFIEIALLMEVLFILNTFGQIFVMTSGGPGIRTTNIPFKIYQDAFIGFNVSRAAAFGVLAVILANIVVLLFLRVLRNQNEQIAEA